MSSLLLRPLLLRAAALIPTDQGFSEPICYAPPADQRSLKDSAWQQKMTDADKRGLTPLFWSNANLYGIIGLGLAA